MSNISPTSQSTKNDPFEIQPFSSGIQNATEATRNTRERNVVKAEEISQQRQERTNQQLPNPSVRQGGRPERRTSEPRFPRPKSPDGILLKPPRRIHQLHNHSSGTQPERAAAEAAEGRLKPGAGSAGSRRRHGHPGRPPPSLPRGLNYSAATTVQRGVGRRGSTAFLGGGDRGGQLFTGAARGTVSSGWGWLTARGGGGRRTRPLLERRTCGSADWGLARGKRATVGFGTWPGAGGVEEEGARHGSTLPFAFFIIPLHACTGKS
jgi:hypothetical protein